MHCSMLVTHRIKKQGESGRAIKEKRALEADYNQTRTEPEPNKSTKWSMMSQLKPNNRIEIH